MNNFFKEQGAALVIALLVLLVLSFLEIALIVTTTSETKIGSTQLMDSQALGVAEAGVEEAITRMNLSSGDVNYIGDPGFPLNPDWRTVVHLNSTLDDTTIGDITYRKSKQLGQPGNPLLYTVEDTSNTEDLLIIRHKTGGTSGDSIYFCDLLDRSQYLEAYDHGGFPVEVIEVTGRKGKAKRRVIAELSRIVLASSVPGEGALFASGYLFQAMSGSTKVCGHNHRMSLPLGSGNYDPPNCDSTDHEYHMEPCKFHWMGQGTDTTTWGNRDLDCPPAGCKPAMKFVTLYTASPGGLPGYWELYGNPAIQVIFGDTSDFPALWEVLGFVSEDSMTSAFDWDTVSNTYDDTLRGPCIVTDDEFTVRSDGYNLGSGVLWVRGSDYNGKLVVEGDYFFKGLIYVQSYFQVGSVTDTESTLRVLGGIMARGDPLSQKVMFNYANVVLCYSGEAIASAFRQSMGIYATLSWREK